MLKFAQLHSCLVQFGLISCLNGKTWAEGLLKQKDKT